MKNKNEDSSNFKVKQKQERIQGIILLCVAHFAMICSFNFEQYAYLFMAVAGIVGSIGTILLLRSFFHIKYKSVDDPEPNKLNYHEKDVKSASNTKLKQLLQKTHNEHMAFPEKVNEIGYTCKEVSFGKYENLPIDWFVIDTDEEKVMLLSKCVIDFLPCCERFFELNKWEKSSMRNWLNGEFYDKAFTQKEKENIIEREYKKNIDKVFFLSKNEVELYLKNKYRKEIFAEMTIYAKQKLSKFGKFELLQGINDSQDYMSWWLRDYSGSFDHVRDYNFCNYEGKISFTNGYWEFKMGAEIKIEIGVRPAVYVNKAFFMKY